MRYDHGRRAKAISDKSEQDTNSEQSENDIRELILGVKQRPQRRRDHDAEAWLNRTPEQQLLTDPGRCSEHERAKWVLDTRRQVLCGLGQAVEHFRLEHHLSLIHI